MHYIEHTHEHPEYSFEPADKVSPARIMLCPKLQNHKNQPDAWRVSFLTLEEMKADDVLPQYVTGLYLIRQDTDMRVTYETAIGAFSGVISFHKLVEYGDNYMAIDVPVYASMLSLVEQGVKERSEKAIQICAYKDSLYSHKIYAHLAHICRQHDINVPTTAISNILHLTHEHLMRADVLSDCPLYAPVGIGDMNAGFLKACAITCYKEKGMTVMSDFIDMLPVLHACKQRHATVALHSFLKLMMIECF